MMTSPRSGLPEESAAPRQLEPGEICSAERIAISIKCALDGRLSSTGLEVVEICESHETLRALAADRDETIKALRAELKIVQDQQSADGRLR